MIHFREIFSGAGTGGVIALALAALTVSVAPASAQSSPAVHSAPLAQGALHAQSAPAAQQDDPLPIKPPPVPGGVILLPRGAPVTAQQSPVPTPLRPLPAAASPLSASPDLAGIQAALASRAISLQEAVAIALYTNREFAASAAGLLQAQGRTGQARAQLNPTAAVNGQFTEYDAPTTANFGAPAGGGAASPGFVIIPQFNPALTAAINLPIDISGTLRSAVSQAQFQEVAARIDVNRVRNDVVYNVKSAFYSALRANAQVAVATETQANALGRLNDANRNYAAGTAPRFDVISAQRDVAEAQQGLINARAQLSVNLAALKNVMGMDVRARMRITGAGAVETPAEAAPLSISISGAVAPPAPIETSAPRPVPPINRSPDVAEAPITQEADDTFDFGPDFEELVGDALRMRPEVLEGEAQIAAARRGVAYARRSSLPSLSVGVSDTYTPNAAGFTRRNQAALVLGVSLPLFDGGMAHARVEEARGAVAAAEVTRRRSADQVKIDVQQAYIALVQARDRVAVANVGLMQAREAFRLSQVRYAAGVSQQAGISPQLELGNAQLTLAQAGSRQVDALYDYNTARAQLDRAVGRYAFTGSAPGYSAVPPPSVRGAVR